MKKILLYASLLTLVTSPLHANQAVPVCPDVVNESTLCVNSASILSIRLVTQPGSGFAEMVEVGVPLDGVQLPQPVGQVQLNNRNFIIFGGSMNDPRFAVEVISD